MTFTKSLHWTIIITIFAALFTPLIVSQSLFFPFIVGKAIFFRVCVEIAFAAWIILAIKETSARPKLSPILYSFLAFVAIIGIADVFGVNLWKSFWSNFERMEGFVTIIHLLAYFIVAGSVLSTEKLWKWFLQVSVGVSALVSFYGLMQFFGRVAVNQGGIRLDSFLGNATYLAVYLIFSIFFALILLVKEKGLLVKSLYGVLIAVHVVVMYNTGTRGAVLGLLAGLFLSAVIIALFDKGERTRRIIASSFIGIVIVVVGGFLMIKNTDFVKQSPVLSRFASISLSDAQTGARSYIWPMAIKGFTERPLLGWGQENFNYIFNANYDPRMYGQEQWFDRAHNVLIDWLVAGGALGLLSYLSLWIFALYLLWRKSTDTSFTEKTLLTGLGVAYFVNNIFVFDNTVSYIMFASVLAYIHFKSTRLVHPIGAKSDDTDSGDMNMVAGLVMICLLVTIYFVNVRAYSTGAALIDALKATTGAQVQADVALEAFTRAISYNTLGRAEVVERLIEAVPQINADSVSLTIRQKYFELASKALEAQLKNAPRDTRYELFSGSFYALYGMNEVALKHFLESKKLSPKKQTVLYPLGNLYIATKKYDDAIATFKEAYEVEESNLTALQYYAVALVTVGKDAEAAKLLKDKTGSADMTSDAFLQAYVNMTKWDKVVTALIQRIKIDPKNMNDRKNLAAAYLQLGNKTAAIKAIRDMITVDPAFKETGEEYIRQIQTTTL